MEKSPSSYLNAGTSQPPPSGVISSGSLKLDILLGQGGYPPGTIVEISGSQASGKTVLCQHAAAEAQRLGRLCAWIDADRSLSQSFAQICGVNSADLYYCDPATTEQALDILVTLAHSGAFSIIVMDSLPSLIPQDEFQGKAQQSPEQINLDLLSDTLHTLGRLISISGTVVLITNRYDPGLAVIYRRLSENPQRLSLKLNASIRIRMSIIEQLQAGEDVIGVKVQARILKNKFAPFLNSTDFDIIHRQGINKPAEVFDLGVSLNQIQQQDGGFRYHSLLLGTSASDAVRFLERNERVSDLVESEIRRKLIPDYFSAAT
jgi:recombination protein RecA